MSSATIASRPNGASPLPSVTRGSAGPELGLVLVFLAAVPQIVGALVLAGPLRRGNPVARVLAWIFIVAKSAVLLGGLHVVERVHADRRPTTRPPTSD